MATCRWRDTVGQTDVRSLQLSLLLVFFALIFVFPLHMVFASLFFFISGGLLPMDFSVSSLHDLKVLFIVYGGTYACMAGTLSWLFRHGMGHAQAASRTSRIEAGVRFLSWGFAAFIGLVSALIALLIPDDGPGWLIMLAGSVYALLSFMGPLLKRYRRHLDRTLPK